MPPFVSLKRLEHVAFLFALRRGGYVDHIMMTQTDDVSDYWSMTRYGFYQYVAWVLR